MSAMTVETQIGYRYLMNKTKSELAYKVLDLLDQLDRYQSALARADDELRNWNGGDKLADDIQKMVHPMYGV